jgi:hypothetical protein
MQSQRAMGRRHGIVNLLAIIWQWRIFNVR